MTITPDPHQDMLQSAIAWLPAANLKPFHELVKTTAHLGVGDTAALLGVDEGFVRSWMPRRRTDGSVESGWEPSGGFISAALSRIGYS